MKNYSPEALKPVESTHYDRNYFLSKCGGADRFQHFIQTSGKEAYDIYKKILSFVYAKPFERVLDVGCGRGEVAAMFANEGLTAVGLDYSTEALEIASHTRLNLPELGRNKIYLVRGDATCIPFDDQKFDAVILSDIVEHLFPWQ